MNNIEASLGTRPEEDVAGYSKGRQKSNGAIADKYALNNPDIARDLSDEDIIYHSEADGERKLVYINKSGSLDWEWIPSPSNDDPKLKGVGRVYSEASSIETEIQDWPIKLKRRCQTRVGFAIGLAMMQDLEAAAATLEAGRGYVQTIAGQRGRIGSVKISLIGLVLILGLTVVSFYFRQSIQVAFGSTFFMLLFSFLSGCFGAVLFLLSSIASKDNDAKIIVSDAKLYELEALARITVGGIGGVLVGLFVKLGLILPVFVQSGQQFVAICSAAMLAGVSERLLNGVITNLASIDENKIRKV